MLLPEVRQRERERDAASLLGGRTPLSRISAFAFQSKGKTKPKRDPRKTRELVRSKKLNSRVLNIGVLSLSFALEIWGPPSYRGFSVLPFPLEPLFRVARTSHSAAGGRRYVLVSGWRPCEEIGQKQRWTSQSGGRRSTRGWETGERWTHMHEGAGGGGECLLLRQRGDFLYFAQRHLLASGAPVPPSRDRAWLERGFVYCTQAGRRGAAPLSL